MQEQPQTQQDVAYETAILDQLRELYLHGTPCSNRELSTLTINDFYRLYR